MFNGTQKEYPVGKLVCESICTKCSKRYSLTSDEMRIIPGTKLNSVKSPRSYLLTWADWIDHISENCPECRFVRPPAACIQDLNRQLDRYIQEKQIDKEIESEEQARERKIQIDQLG